MVPLKHRAPELQRSIAPEKFLGFLFLYEREKEREQIWVLLKKNSNSRNKVKISLPLVYLGSNHYWLYTWYLFISLSCCGLMENTHLGLAFPLRCFQRLCTPCVATQRFLLEKELIDYRHDHYRSSRTMSDWPQYSNANIGFGPNCLTHAIPFPSSLTPVPGDRMGSLF